MKTILIRASFAGLFAASTIHAQSMRALDPNQVSARYTVTDLGVVGGPPAQPFVITNNSLISGGVAVTDTVFHAVLWFQGMKLDIGKPGLGGPSSVAFSVNESGQSVGQAETANLDPNGEDFCGFGSQRVCHPFIWQNGLMAPLPLLKGSNGLAGTNGVANSINNRGQVVGVSENAQRDSTCPPLNHSLGQYQQFQFKPVLWQNGAVQELPTVSADPDGIAFSINVKGQAAGASGYCTSFQANGDLTYLFGAHAALWENGAVTDLGNLGGAASGAQTIALFVNNRGQVVGGSGAADGTPRGFLWSKEAGIQEVGTVQGDVGSVALAINDGGDVVGISFDQSFNPTAFLRPDGGAPVDLNSIISADSPLFLFDACSINTRGEIIGIAVDAEGRFHGFLATPANGAGNSPAATSDANSHAEFDSARRLLRQRLGFSTFRR